MLDPETAREHLRDAASENPLSLRVERARGLPPAPRAAAFSLLGCDLEGNLFTSYRTSPGRVEAQTEAAALCDSISVPEREQLFRAFFPRLGGAMARWWSPDVSPLHQVGWNPRPFRLLNNADGSRAARLHQLQSLLSDSPHFGIGRYCEQGPLWFATYAPYVGSEGSRAMIGDRLGAVLSTAIDRNDPAESNAIQEVLILSARGEHPIGAMGRHVVRALLSSSRPEGWREMARLLAESGEDAGVRRQILEVAGEAHPEAFLKILGVIREKNLLRFPDVVLTVISWFGVEEEGFAVTDGNVILARVEQFLVDSVAREKTIFHGTEPTTVYYALWCAAFLNVRAAIGIAARLLRDVDAERRYAAAYLLAQTRLPEAEPALLTALGDTDIRVAAFAFGVADWTSAMSVAASADEAGVTAPAPALASSEAERKEQEREGGLLGALRGFVAKVSRRENGPKGGKDLNPVASIPEPVFAPVVTPLGRFDQVARNLPRFPAKERQLEPIIWGWTRRPAAQSDLADVLPGLLDGQPVSRLYPFLPIMSANGRWQLVGVIAALRPRTIESTNLLITLLGDGAANVRQRAADALKRFPIGEAEEMRLEGVLMSKQPLDMQRPAMAILLGRPDEAVLTAVGRLLGYPEHEGRAIGLAILAQLLEKRRATEAGRDMLEGWLNGMEPAALSEAEAEQLKSLLPPRRMATLNAARVRR